MTINYGGKKIEKIRFGGAEFSGSKKLDTNSSFTGVV